MITKEQLLARREGIGASDAAAVVGIPAFNTPLEIWLYKTGRLEPEEVNINSPAYWGNLLEDDVADAYADFTGHKVRKANATLRHADHPWMLCHLDRLVIGKRIILECKTADKNMAYLWGDSGTDQIPDPYLIQVQHQMAVKRYHEAHVAVLIGGNDFRCYPIRRDEQLINFIVSKEHHFWHNHVLADVPPPSVSRQDLALLHTQDTGEFIEAPPEIADVVKNLKKVKSLLGTLTEDKEKLEHAITSCIGSATGITFEGQVIATWKADKNGRRTLRLT